MQNISVHYETYIDDPDDECCEPIGTWTFKFLDTFTLKIEWSDPKGRDWTKFLAALRSKTRADVTFCDSNGTVAVYCCDGRVTFTISKHGAGGDGSVDIEVKVTDELIECFERAARELQ